MPNIHLAFIPLLRTTFDVPFAQQMTQAAHDSLRQAGYHITHFAPVTTLDEAHALLPTLAQVDADVVILFQATFADTTMATALLPAIHAPIVLWGVPEAHTGGRLRLNSLCGINLTAHALKRMGRAYRYLYGAPDSAVTLERLRPLALAAYTARTLRGLRLGRLGVHPDGFETCDYDAPTLAKRFGIQVETFELVDVFQQIRQVDSAVVDAVYQAVAGQVNGLDTLAPEPTRGTLATFHTLQRLAQEQHLAGWAVRCWPQFFTDLGCAACGAMALLNTQGIPCGCETDMNGTLTQLMLQTLCGEPAFGTDIVSVDVERNGLVLWHCGQAPLTMAEGQAGVTIHSNRKLPLLFDFTLKAGRVTLARLSEAGGVYRMVIARGEMVSAPPAFNGTSGIVQFERPVQSVLDTLMMEGLEHHIALVYGDYVDALQELAQLWDMPCLVLG